ncbi:DUF6174 domain-containing protein [Armatimonas rosea]|uniref:Lipoprotein n=1 Tax=Armatimonas rosea TaxID=685828 RepID=A0A7W9SM11_ARMRO|nr:DUF6174 domain-containing protein [Armatimonas rosea]MBB6049122.1 hypothetical protein [Armatimonas rosea]
MGKRTILLVLLVLAGCGGGTAVSDLDQARASWRAQGLRSYSVTVQKICFCPEEYTRPVTITVRDGVATNAPEYLAAYGTVEKALDAVESAQKGKPDTLTVSFAPQGWPTSLYVDPSKALADDEYRVLLSAVTPL